MFIDQCSLVKQGVNAFGSICLSVCVHGYFVRALLVVLHVRSIFRDFPCGLQQKTSTSAFSDTGKLSVITRHMWMISVGMFDKL